MPDSISSCGELIAPPERMTSRSARHEAALALMDIFDADRARALDHDSA